jgi:hypothetical protein
MQQEDLQLRDPLWYKRRVRVTNISNRTVREIEICGRNMIVPCPSSTPEKLRRSDGGLHPFDLNPGTSVDVDVAESKLVENQGMMFDICREDPQGKPTPMPHEDGGAYQVEITISAIDLPLERHMLTFRASTDMLGLSL